MLVYQAKAWHPEDLFHGRQPCSSPHLEVLASHRFQGRQAWNLIRHAFLLRLQQEMQRMQRDLPSLQQRLARERPSTWEFPHPEQ